MTEIKSVVCPICGCLCDDLEVTVENNEIVKMKNGCAQCEAKMVHGYKSEERILKPMIRKDGKLVPVSMDEAVHKAAQILTDAKYPLLFGWSSSTSEAQRVGVELAEELGSALDNCCSVCHGPSVMADTRNRHPFMYSWANQTPCRPHNLLGMRPMGFTPKTS